MHIMEGFLPSPWCTRLKALNGENSLIITTGGMVGHVRRRIAEHGDESGRVIPVTLVQESASPGRGREPALE